MPPPATCTGPSCRRPAVALGLCHAHYRQQRQGKPLTALRTGDRRPVTIRVSPPAAERVSEDRDGAREAIERWAVGKRA